MLFTKSLLLGAFALASSAAAQGQVAFTTTFNSVQAGDTIPITYMGGDNTPVEISLRKGEARNLGAPTVITSSATGGSYSWSVPTSLEDGSDYALQIKQGSTVNYSNQFGVTGGSGTAPASSVSSALSSASSVISSAVSSATASLNSSLRNATATSGNATVTSATLTSTDATATETATETDATTTTEEDSATATAADAASGATSSAAPTSGAMSIGVSSPLALILTAIAAMVYLK